MTTAQQSQLLHTPEERPVRTAGRLHAEARAIKDHLILLQDLAWRSGEVGYALRAERTLQRALARQLRRWEAFKAI